MGGSQATVTPSNMDIGPCQVVYNSIDLGGTADGVKIKWKYDKSWIQADQFGKTKLDGAISGLDCTIATAFLESRNKVNFQGVFPSGILAGTIPHQYIDWKDQTAVRQLALAQPLLLHPLVEVTSSFDQDWYFYKAIPMEDTEYDFSPTAQAKLKITWQVLLDTSVSPARLFRTGNHSL